MRLKLALAAVIALFSIGLAAPAAADTPAPPVVVDYITPPVQHDDCGPEVDEHGAYIGYAWDHWTFGKNVGVSKTLVTWLDGRGYQVRADARPGYVIADGVQRVWEFPPFTDEPC